MKPFSLLFIAFILCLTTTSAQHITGEIKEQIIIPDTGFIKVYGENARDVYPHKYALPVKAIIDADDSRQDIIVMRNSQLPVFIEKKKSALKIASGLNPEKQLFSFLNEINAVTNISFPEEHFRVVKTFTDELGTIHVRTVQHYKGIDIYGSETTFHTDGDRERLTGTVHNLTKADPHPHIDTMQALAIVENDLGIQIKHRELTQAEKDFFGDSETQCQLIFMNTGANEYKLAWMFTVRPGVFSEWKYFIDARNGEILRKYNNIRSDGTVSASGVDLNNMMRTFNVYLTGGIFYLYDISQKMFNAATNEGIIITLDANNTATENLDVSYVTSVDNAWTQAAAISAHCNAIQFYKYFERTFGWNSVNGAGGNIISIVNLAADDGSALENAFWNGKAVFYGNGGENFKPLAGALDVTAHELSHGVIDAAANLEYYGQAGAINESYADIFACLVDSLDWTIGEDVTKESFSPSGAMRNMADPHNMGDSSKPYWQPMHVSEMNLDSEDNNGIHINSGICNYAFYLLASRIGRNNAARIYFRALTTYLTRTASFTDLRIAIVQSARDLFGDYSQAMTEAARAFEEVGIYEEEPVEAKSYETNPGKQMLLSYDTNPEDPVSLYHSTALGTSYRPITNTVMRGKASVTDDGSKAVFVSNDRRLRTINTNSPEISETIISGFGYYDHAAIAKDGKRIAATKGFMDGSIYVFDLVSGQSRQFILYNPTTSNGTVDKGSVLKAYSLEFDITGEYIIYDANNVISSSNLKDINYRDIGIIRVWDNKNNSFGDGKITKPFSSLPAHVTLANPVFSKNSPFIIAFDYFYDDGIIEVYKIYGANLETGETKPIVVNDRLGYPSFSTKDDRIAYSTINGFNTQVVKSIKLKTDKISYDGDPGVLVPDAKWPVYFSTGVRPLGLQPVSNFTADYKRGNYMLTTRFIDMTQNSPQNWHWLFEGGEPAESFEENPVVNYNSVGAFKVTLITANQFGSDTLTRENYIQVVDPTPSDNSFPEYIALYPNPVNKTLHITCISPFEINIYNMQGKPILSSHEHQIDVSWLKPGMYIVELKTTSAILKQKIIKD